MAASKSKGRSYAICPTSQWRSLRQHKGDHMALLVSQYLRSNRHSTMLGLYHFPAEYLMADLGLSAEESRRSLEVLALTKSPSEAPWGGASQGASEALRAARLGAFALWDSVDEIVWVIDMARWEIAPILKPRDNRAKSVEGLLEQILAEFPASPLPSAWRCYYSDFWDLPLLGEWRSEAPAQGASEGPAQAPSKPLPKGLPKGVPKALGKPASGSFRQLPAGKRAARAREDDPDDPQPVSAAKPKRAARAREDDLLAYAAPILSAWVEVHGLPRRLSAKDKIQLATWLDSGVTASCVAQVIRAKGPMDVGSLRYYGEPDGGAVATAWREPERVISRLSAAAAPAVVEDLDVAGRLGRLAQRLDRVRFFDPSTLRDLDPSGTVEAIDQQLGDLDAQMLEQAETTLDPSAAAELAERVAASVEALRARVGAPNPQALRRVETRHLRDLLELPVLSLFSIDAMQTEEQADA